MILKRKRVPANRKRKGRQKIILIAAIIVLVVIVALIVLLTGIVKKYIPSNDETDLASFYGLEQDEDVLINFDNTILESRAMYLDDNIYVSYDVLHGYLNSRFYWDGTEEVLRYTLPEGIVSVVPDTEQYTVAKDSRSEDYTIVRVEDGQMYVALPFVAEYTDLRYEYYTDPDRVVISDEMGEVEYTSVKRDSQIRELGGVKSSILTEVKKGDLVTVLDELDDWDEVCTQDGFVGYIKKKALGSTVFTEYESDFTQPEFSHITRSYTINMAWHQVTNQTANSSVDSVIASTEGLNVISPTWFYLDDDDGGIASLASTDYVNYCHKQGIEVWALVSNIENPDVDTTKVLSTTSSRDALVNNLISEAIRCDMDGINVDFEQLAGEAGEGFLQFIRELSLKCASNSIVLSVDNYAPASYNAFYSRDEQAVFADYIVLMAYDEHYNGSDEGSVASLSFVEQSVADTLKEVPSEQLILGMPFYTRVWKLTPDEDDAVSEGTDAADAGGDADDAGDGSSGYTLSSEAVSMSEAESRVAANGAAMQWLDDCGQYYAEYENGGSTYKIWLEDQNSLEKKLDVMKDNSLAGAAFWKLGYEKNTVWDTIVKYMQ